VEVALLRIDELRIAGEVVGENRPRLGIVADAAAVRIDDIVAHVGLTRSAGAIVGVGDGESLALVVVDRVVVAAGRLAG